MIPFKRESGSETVSYFHKKPVIPQWIKLWAKNTFSSQFKSHVELDTDRVMKHLCSFFFFFVNAELLAIYISTVSSVPNTSFVCFVKFFKKHLFLKIKFEFCGAIVCQKIWVLGAVKDRRKVIEIWSKIDWSDKEVGLSFVAKKIWCNGVRPGFLSQEMILRPRI